MFLGQVGDSDIVNSEAMNLIKDLHVNIIKIHHASVLALPRQAMLYLNTESWQGVFMIVAPK